MKFPPIFSFWFSGSNKTHQMSQVGQQKGGQKPPKELDALLLWSAGFLLLFGLVMVFSSSIAFADGSKISSYRPEFFLYRHAIFLTLGLVFGLCAFRIPMSTWQNNAPLLFGIGLLLLIMVLVPHIGRQVNGAKRWIPVGPVNIQPSELMKLLTVIFVAYYTDRKLSHMESFKKAFVPMACMMVIMSLLLLSEPDFGALVVISTITFGILFLGGLRLRIFVLLSSLASVIFLIEIWVSPYRRERLFNFIDPFKNPLGSGYQLSHSLIAFGRGEWFGVGLGASIEKLFYLPEAHTDFLLAVIAEELGFIGVLTVIVLFVIVIYRAFAIGRRAVVLGRYFSSLVAQGIGIWIGVQSFVNMGVNMGLLPTKGLTLPFMSFGGSGIIVNCIALAILLRVDWETRKEMRRSGGV